MQVCGKDCQFYSQMNCSRGLYDEAEKIHYFDEGLYNSLFYRKNHLDLARFEITGDELTLLSLQCSLEQRHDELVEILYEYSTEESASGCANESFTKATLSTILS